MPPFELCGYGTIDTEGHRSGAHSRRHVHPLNDYSCTWSPQSVLYDVDDSTMSMLIQGQTGMTTFARIHGPCTFARNPCTTKMRIDAFGQVDSKLPPRHLGHLGHCPTHCIAGGHIALREPVVRDAVHCRATLGQFIATRDARTIALRATTLLEGAGQGRDSRRDGGRTEGLEEVGARRRWEWPGRARLRVQGRERGRTRGLEGSGIEGHV